MEEKIERDKLKLKTHHRTPLKYETSQVSLQKLRLPVTDVTYEPLQTNMSDIRFLLSLCFSI